MNNKISAALITALLLTVLVSGCLNSVPDSVPEECVDEYKFSKVCFKDCKKLMKKEGFSGDLIAMMCKMRCDELYDECIRTLTYDQCLAGCAEYYPVDVYLKYVCADSCTESAGYGGYEGY